MVREYLDRRWSGQWAADTALAWFVAVAGRDPGLRSGVQATRRSAAALGRRVEAS
jgi:hypothetical protein